jgi:outer membrane protein TolC
MNNFKKQIINKSTIFSLMVTIPSFVNAEDLDLKKALTEFKQSPRIEKNESQVKEAKWKKMGSLAGFLPDITAKAYHMFDQKYIFADVTLGGSNVSVPSLVPSTDYSIGFQMPLFDGFANINRYSAASHFENGAIKELEWSQFQGEREVILLYYKAIASNSLLEVAKRNLNALNDHLNDVKLFKKSGISTKFDVLRVEVQQSEAQTELMNAEDNVKNTLIRLGETLGKSLEERKIAGSLPVLDSNLISNANNNSIEKRFDILSLEEKLKSLQEMDSADSKYLIPKLGLFGNYEKYNNRNTDLLGGDGFRNAYNIGINLTWNLFDGMKSISKDKVSFEQKIQLEKTLFMAKTKALNDSTFWQRKYHYFSDVYKARKSDIERAQESVRLAKEGRKVGTRTNTDLLDTEAELYRAEAASINAQISTIESLINYELSTGQQVYQF